MTECCVLIISASEERPTKGPPDGKGFEYIYACLEGSVGRQGGEICAMLGQQCARNVAENDDGNAVFGR